MILAPEAAGQAGGVIKEGVVLRERCGFSKCGPPKIGFANFDQLYLEAQAESGKVFGHFL